MEYKCGYCGKKGERKQSALKGVKTPYCSNKCKELGRARPTVNCSFCGSEIRRRPSAIARAKYHYCGSECKLGHRDQLRPERVQTCKQCDRRFHTNPAYILRRRGHNRFCSVECKRNFDKSRAGKPASVRASGYIGVFGRQTRHHRLVAEQLLGCALPTNLHVHHINGDKADNRVRNLAVLPAGLHHKLHARIRRGDITYRDSEKEISAYRVSTLRKDPDVYLASLGEEA